MRLIERYVGYSKKIFTVSFIGFSFIAFSGVFPTGFSAVFSTVAFITAIPLFLSKINKINLNRHEFIGLILFSWLVCTIFWSEVSILTSLSALFEYRFFILVPLCSLVLTNDSSTQKNALAAALLGAGIALFASWCIGLGWLSLESGQKSLGDRIYHGFVMAVLLIACFCMAKERTGVMRVLALTVAGLVIYNVLNLEDGRTGYLILIVLCVVFIFLSFRGIRLAIALSSAAILLVLFFQYLGNFQDRLNETRLNIEKMLVTGDYRSSVGYRLEFYRVAAKIGLENPVFGVGVGDVVSELKSRKDNEETDVLTDNVHSEYLNMLLMGGIPASFLYFWYLSSIVKLGLAQRSKLGWLGDALIGVGCLIIVSTMFNSSIKDYGEKHALVIILSLLNSMIADRSTNVDKS